MYFYHCMYKHGFCHLWLEVSFMYRTNVYENSRRSDLAHNKTTLVRIHIEWI